MADTDNPFDHLETADDHHDRADRLVEDAEEMVSQQISEELPFEATVTASAPKEGATFDVEIVPTALHDLELPGEMNLTLTAPASVQVFDGEDPYDLPGPTPPGQVSERDRIRNFKQLIEEIERHHEEGAPVDAVLRYAGSVGLDREKAEKELEKLRRKGEVYESRQGHLRTT